MAKRKNGPALLELMQREKEEAAIQAADETNGRKSWLSRISRGRLAGLVNAAAPPVETEAAVEPVLKSEPTSEPPIVEDRFAVEEQFVEVEPAVPTPIVKAIPAPAPRAEPIESFEPPRMFWVEDGRVHLSLNPVSSVVAGGSLLLAIFAGFVMGRVTAADVGEPPQPGPAQAVSPIEEAVKGPANPMVLDDPAGKRAEPVERKAVPAPAATKVAGIESADPREPGKNYFLLMTANPEDRNDAEHARGFLADRKIRAVIERDKQGRWMVFDAGRGFTRKELNATAFQERRMMLERLGHQFRRTNLRYGFNKPAPWLYEGR